MIQPFCSKVKFEIIFKKITGKQKEKIYTRYNKIKSQLFEKTNKYSYNTDSVGQ